MIDRRRPSGETHRVSAHTASRRHLEETRRKHSLHRTKNRCNAAALRACNRFRHAHGVGRSQQRSMIRNARGCRAAHAEQQKSEQRCGIDGWQRDSEHTGRSQEEEDHNATALNERGYHARFPRQTRFHAAASAWQTHKQHPHGGCAGIKISCLRPWWFLKITPAAEDLIL